MYGERSPSVVEKMFIKCAYRLGVLPGPNDRCSSRQLRASLIHLFDILNSLIVSFLVLKRVIDDQ